jgi:hypothetical protein
MSREWIVLEPEVQNSRDTADDPERVQDQVADCPPSVSKESPYSIFRAQAVTRDTASVVDVSGLLSDILVASLTAHGVRIRRTPPITRGASGVACMGML